MPCQESSQLPRADLHCQLLVDILKHKNIDMVMTCAHNAEGFPARELHAISAAHAPPQVVWYYEMHRMSMTA